MKTKQGFAGIMVLIIVAVVIIAGGAYVLTRQSVKVEPSPLIGGDKDSHGCLIAAGYSWCEVKQKCLRTWEEKCEVATTTQDQAADWKTYTNDKYGFEFQYPAYLGDLGDMPSQIEKIDCNSEGYDEVPLASFTHFGLDLACPSALINHQYQTNKENITVAGRSSVYFDYTSSLSYHTKEAYIPINNGYYLVIGHSYKAGRPEYVEFSSVDFKRLLSTFKFTK